LISVRSANMIPRAWFHVVVNYLHGRPLIHSALF